jgi:hypothetical protein
MPSLVSTSGASPMRCVLYGTRSSPSSSLIRASGMNAIRLSASPEDISTATQVRYPSVA